MPPTPADRLGPAVGISWIETDLSPKQANARMDSESLGFAPEARVLILNRDDLGLHEAVNTLRSSMPFKMVSPRPAA
jgi:hypothetical protein